MTTNKPEVKRFNILTYQGAIQSQGAMCVLASDYDALQAECEKLRKLATECADYLDTNDMTSIAHGSVLHRRLIDAAMQGDQP